MRQATTYRFGAFVLQTGTLELLKYGVRIKLGRQPARLLCLLVERHGAVLSRDELRAEIWPETFVDFDASLNTAMRKVRAALGDNAENPRFIETVPKRGYRFLAAVEAEEARLPEVPLTPEAPRRRTLAAAAAVLLLLAGAAAFEKWRPAPTGGFTARFESLAVLPFENLSGDVAQEYLADGTTDQLITNLAQLPGLRVTSRTSVMRYKNTRRSLPDIARELGVDALVEGSVARSGDRIRIAAKLLLGRSDKHLWADSFQRETGDVLAVQEDIAAAVTREVQGRLDTRVRTAWLPWRPVNLQAYDLYMRGRHLWRSREPGSLLAAVRYFEQALARDPHYAPAYSGLADCQIILAAHAPIAAEDHFAAARAAAAKAIALDATLAEPHATLGLARFYGDYDFPGAGREFSRALELNPNYAEARHWYAYWLTAVGRPIEAAVQIRRAAQLDPFAFSVQSSVGEMLYFARDYGGAIQALDRSLRLFPEQSYLHAYLGLSYGKLTRDTEAARHWLLALPSLAGPDRREPVPLRAVAARLHGAGQNDDDKLPAAVCAELAAIGGDKEEAFFWLEKARQAHANVPFLFLKADPAFDGLRPDPRFQALLRQMRLD